MNINCEDLNDLNLLTSVSSHPQWMEYPDFPPTNDGMTLIPHLRIQTDTKTGLSIFATRGAIHFVQQLPIPANALHTMDFPPAEQKRIDGLLADADFREATSRQNQIAIAEKHLRGFLDGKCMTFEAISHFLGVTCTIIMNR
jgi:hypothetical protein